MNIRMSSYQKGVYVNILLIKREGRTGRISARGLHSTDRAQRGPYKKDLGPITLVNERVIIRLKKALKVFHKQCPVQYLENIGPVIEHFDWLILVIGPLTA